MFSNEAIYWLHKIRILKVPFTMEHLAHAFNFCSYRANTIPLAPEITRLCGAKLIKNMGNFDEKV